MAIEILSNSYILRKKKKKKKIHPRGDNEVTRPLSGALIPLECSAEPRRQLVRYRRFDVQERGLVERKVWESLV